MIRFWYFIALLLLIAGCAGTRTDQPATWVERTLSNLSIEQKVGQMMVLAYTPRFYNQQSFQSRQLTRRIKKYHLGGVAFVNKTPPYAFVRFLERVQQEANIPLLVMADVEWGVTMRLEEGTNFLQNMAVGATGSEEYAYEMGKITAQEARALGIHVGFVPALDVNNNPDNIIINTRSYGEDPQLVARLGAAYIRGLQEHGLYATAKHFPGHGDTDVDSHLGLPVITASREHIRNIELLPFQAAVDAGVQGIMVAHITYSAFPQMGGRPATLDPYFIQEILKKEMGFEGLLITDAMGMGGIVNNYWSGEAAVRAINAGMDIILMPPNFEVTVEFVIQAVKEGRIAIDRIDDGVRKILQIKYHFGLTEYPTIELENLETVLASPAHLQKAREIANAAMTLVKDEKNILPLAAEELDSALVVTITDGDEGFIFNHQLQAEVVKRIPVVRTALLDRRSCEADVQNIFTKSDSAEVLIVGLFVKWGSYKGSATLPDTTVKLITRLFEIDKPMAVVAFGTPYLLRKMPAVPSYLCAYGTEPLAIGAATRAIFGEIPVTGKLPVSIPGYYDIGEGLEQPVRKMQLVKDINDDILQKAYAVLEEAIADSVFPGAQLAVVRDGRLIASRGFGRQTYSPKSPGVDTETIYDLASVTKVAATTLVAMRLWEQKKIQLDIPVKSYLPEFTGGLKDSVTIRHLLTHSSGVHWWDDLWNKAKNKEEALKYIYQLPLDYSPGDSMIYSDLGLIMMGEILQTVTGKPIDQLAQRMIYQPMGMENTMYNPPENLLPRIAPTEIGGSMNRGLIHGEVHDENTFFFNGVSTHAGLFSTAEDLAALAQMLLNGGIYRHHRFFSPRTIRCWTARQNIPPGSVRALGWTTPSEKNSLAGDYFSKGSFGHTGFTGTSLWIDPHRKIAVILLTNRVHPTRERGGMSAVRYRFHNEVMKALLKDMGEEVEEQPLEVKSEENL